MARKRRKSHTTRKKPPKEKKLNAKNTATVATPKPANKQNGAPLAVSSPSLLPLEQFQSFHTVAVPTNQRRHCYSWTLHAFPVTRLFARSLHLLPIPNGRQQMDMIMSKDLGWRNLLTAEPFAMDRNTSQQLLCCTKRAHGCKSDA